MTTQKNQKQKLVCYNTDMKTVLILILSSFLLQAKTEDRHGFYATIYLPSVHFTKNDHTGEAFNEKHNVWGVEYLFKEKYTLSYNNFTNSRYKEVDLYGAGYLIPFSQPFGLHLIAGYQKGYCFDGFLRSTECSEGKKNESLFLLPLLYYKHKYFKLDFFTNSNMIAFRVNLKLNDFFSVK